MIKFSNSFKFEKVIKGIKHNKEKLFLCLCLVSLLISFLYINIINPIIPLNSDEAWNYFRFARFGPIYSIFNYDGDNFHIFFTLLQSLTVPSFLLQYFPTALRLANTIVGVLFFVYLFFIAKKFIKRKYLFWIIVIFCCYFICPIATPYFIMARGYLVGMLFLLMGTYALISKKFYLAALFFILSGWSVPTYVYTFPFIYSYLFIVEKQKKQVILSAVLIIVGLFICYLPAVKRISAVTNIYGISSLNEFLDESVIYFSNLSFLKYGNILNEIFIFSYFLGLFKLLKENVNQRVKKFVLLLFFSISGYYFFVICLSILLNINEPFLRNGLFVSVFAGISISLAAFLAKNNIIKFFLIFMLLLNAITGFYLFATNFIYKEVSYPGFQGEQKYTFSNLLMQIKEKRHVVIPRELRNAPLVMFYLYLYSPPSLTSNKKIITNTKKISLDLPISELSPPRDEFNPIILPTNKLYIVKKGIQTSSINILNYTDSSRVSSMYYLLYLSDNTYSEAESLWRKGEWEVSIKTLARAENFMTIFSNDSVILIQRGKPDRRMFEEAQKSLLLHEDILNKILNSKYGISDNIKSALIYFFKNNYSRIKLINK